MLSVKLSSLVFCEQIARRFERLLEQFSCVRQLSLPGCRLDPPAVVRLCRVLQLNTSLYSLHLGGVRLGDDGVMLLAHALQRNPSLRVLGLTGNELTGRGCRLLVRAIGRSRAISDLDLSDNRIGNCGCRELGALLSGQNCPLRALSVCNNGIGAGGALALFAALRRNSRLVRLDVSRNAVGDESSRELAAALIFNRTLRHLTAADCDLTAATCRELARPLRTNTVLRAVELDRNERIDDAGVEALADSLRYNRSLRRLSFNRCGLTGLALGHILAALRHNNTIRTVDVRPSDKPPSPSNRQSAAAHDDDGCHGNVTSSPAPELSMILRANPLLRILA